MPASLATSMMNLDHGLYPVDGIFRCISAIEAVDDLSSPLKNGASWSLLQSPTGVTLICHDPRP